MTFGEFMTCLLVIGLIFVADIIIAQVCLAIFPKLGRWIYVVGAIASWITWLMSMDVDVSDLVTELAWMDWNEGIVAVLPLILASIALEFSKKKKLIVKFENRTNKEDRA